MYTQTSTHTHSCTRTHRHAHGRTSPPAHTLACMHTRTCANTCAHTCNHARADTPAHTLARTHTPAPTHTHERTHARKHTRTHAHTRTLLTGGANSGSGNRARAVVRSGREPSPGADAVRMSPVPAQMWQGCAQSRCRCGSGGPGVPVAVWRGREPDALKVVDPVTLGAVAADELTLHATHD